ncbi:hypothetical protein PYW07_016251 [Mythimna separata]|uniref:Uncharacterized protein n=1 Tax=Mythimna separata TaxID=271217 RepID=A0AAD8DW10_MYTSE|nr:hypothetical protein PYW07_016251 [Mythimna separata]
METLLEEIALIAGGSAASTPITPAAVDHAVAHCADLWGLLQPYSHLNAGRVASVSLYRYIYLCAGMETLLEEIALIAGGSAASTPITPAAVDHAVAHCADLWGLLQPYSHLNAGRVASGN